MPNALASVAEECTTFVWKTATWIQSMGSYGNAYQWLGEAQAKGFQTSATPSPGAIVVYGRGNGYDPNAGHVAIVDQVLSNGSFTVSESNDPYGSGPRSGRVSTLAGVEGFILPPGAPTVSTPSSLVPNSGSNHQTFGTVLSTGSGVTGVTSGIFAWFAQSSTWQTIAIGAAGVGLIVYGLKFLGAPSPVNLVKNV